LPQGKATKFFHSPNLVVTKMVNKYGLVTIFVVTKPMMTNKFQNDNQEKFDLRSPLKSFQKYVACHLFLAIEKL